MAKHEPQYIADTAYAASRLRITSDQASKMPDGIYGQLTAARAVGKALSDYELYTFDRSAINAARDLRMDTPERVDRLVEAVLRSPRRIFIEAELEDLLELTSGMRDFLFPENEDAISHNKRWGVLIDIEGEGRARFRAVLQADKEWMSKPPQNAVLKQAVRALGPRERERAWPAVGLITLPGYVDIDISRHVGFSRDEFEALFEKVQDSRDPIYKHAQKLSAKASGSRERRKIIGDAWRATRFRDILRHHHGRPGEPLDAMPTDQADETRLRSEYLSSALRIIAMLAVLQADADDLLSTPRQAKPRRSKSQRKAGAMRARDMAPGLSVVTLNLEDRQLQQIYERRGGADTSLAHEGDPDHGGRVRHPVRGHLFLARNGKMTWRKPHWRGSLDKPTLRRVVAPSHKA